MNENKKEMMQVLLYNKIVRDFPNCPKAVPFELLDEETAKRNHCQSLRRLNERGGLVPSEMVAVIRKQKYIEMPNSDAIEIINNALSEWVMATTPTEVKAVDEGESVAPDWYDALCIDSWLTNKMTHMGYPREFIVSVSKFISESYADKLQRAYAKGWERGHNDSKNSNTFDYVYYPKTVDEVAKLNAQQSERSKLIAEIERLVAKYESEIGDSKISDSTIPDNSLKINALTDLLNTFKQ